MGIVLHAKFDADHPTVLVGTGASKCKISLKLQFSAAFHP